MRLYKTSLPKTAAGTAAVCVGTAVGVRVVLRRGRKGSKGRGRCGQRLAVRCVRVLELRIFLVSRMRPNDGRSSPSRTTSIEGVLGLWSSGRNEPLFQNGGKHGIGAVLATWVKDTSLFRTVGDTILYGLTTFGESRARYGRGLAYVCRRLCQHGHNSRYYTARFRAPLPFCGRVLPAVRGRTDTVLPLVSEFHEHHRRHHDKQQDARLVGRKSSHTLSLG